MAEAQEICRICLRNNVKMYLLKNTNIENLYNLLTYNQAYLDIDDGKTATVCFLCYARLRQCERLQQQAIKSNELLEQLLKGGFMHPTANAILSSQYTSHDLQVSSMYHLDLKPATCEDGFLVPIVQGDSLISVKEELEEAKHEGHDVTDLDPMTCEDVLLYPKVEANSLISVKEENEAIHEEYNVTDFFKDKNNSYDFDAEAIHSNSEDNNVDNNLLIAIYSKTSDQIKDIAHGMKRRKQYEQEKLCIIQPEIEVKNDPHFFNVTQIQQKGKTSNINVEAKGIYIKSEKNLEKKKSTFVTKKEKFKKFIDNDVNIGVDMKGKRNLEKVNTNILPNENTQNVYINDLKTSVINTIIHGFQCNECGKQFSTKDTLTDHILNCKKYAESSVNDNQVETYRCDICTFKTYNKFSIETHSKMHSITNVLSCNICEYKCAHMSRLKNHMKKHTGEKPFSCNICAYSCGNVSNLKKHMQKHTGEKPFCCNICKYRCAQKTDLKRHMTKHTGEKPFSCDICEYRCLHRANLRQHMKAHTGEKPFSCNICEYRCAKNTDLKRHMRTHTGEKPFSCNICDYKCTQKRHLKRHTLKHAVN